MKNPSLLRPGGALSVAAVLLFLFALLGFGVTEELGVGGFKGRLLSPITGGAVKNITVVLRPTTSDPNWDIKVRTARSNEKGDFAFAGVPAGQYVLSAYGNSMYIEQKPVLIIEGKTETIDYKMECSVPYVSMDMSQHVFLPGEEPVVQMRGSAGESVAKVQAWQVPWKMMTDSGGLDPMVNQIRRREDSKAGPSIVPTGLVNVVSKDWTIRKRDGEGIFVERIGLGQLKEGMYLIATTIGAVTEVTYALVSQIALVSKTASSEALAFVTDLKSGKPIGGAEVSMMSAFQERPMGKTNASGWVRKTINSPNGNMMMVARVGASVAISRAPLYIRDGSDKVRAFTHCDRPVYRPGDKVFFRSIIREAISTGYQLPSATNANITIQDPDGNDIKSFTAPISKHGILTGEFDTVKEVTGGYQVIIKIGEKTISKWVEVASYRKPEYSITVTPLKEVYTRNEEVKMRVKMTYYFGGPVVGAKVSSWVNAAPLYSYTDYETGDSEEYSYDEGGQFLASLDDVVTDEKGEVILSFKRPKPENDNPRYPYFGEDEKLIFNVSATEQGDKYFEAKGSVKLVQGQYALDLNTEGIYGKPGESQTINAIVKTHDGKPAQGVSVSFESGFDDWDRKTGKSFFVKLQDFQGATDSEGIAKFTFTPDKSGSLRIRARIKDQSGEVIGSEVWLWCWDGVSEADFGPLTSLETKLDKKQYQPGDTATLVIRTENSGGSALVTIEGDTLYDQRVVELKGPVTAVKIPVTKTFAPNVYVAVTMVTNKRLIESQRRLAVTDPSKRVIVKITPDKQTAEPGDTVNYLVQTTNEKGLPVSAQVSLGVVDESIYAIREDFDDPMDEFYARRYNSVATNYSFEEIYLDGGEKGPVNIEIREKFEDTAFWNPNVETSPSGRASIAVVLPDNLTSWRATALAATDDSAFGKSKSNIIARKPLMVRLSAPAYFTQDDEFRVTATVNNGTTTKQNVEVRLVAPGLELTGEATQRVSVDAEGRATVEWTAKAGGPGSVEMTVTASAASVNDGMRLTIPIRAKGRKVIRYEAGEIEAGKTLTIERLAGAEEGQVTLTLTPSLASSVVQSLDELVDYPYGCVEQTMSRFMPAVVAGKIIQDLKLDQPKVLQKVPEVARQSIRRLRTMQHEDGGFGWWENDTSDSAMSALVLEGLTRSAAAGYAIDAGMRDKVLKWCTAYLSAPRKTPDWIKTAEQREWWTIDQTNKEAAVALSISLVNNAARNSVLNLPPDKLNDGSLAGLAIAANRIAKRNPNDSAIKSRRDDLLGELRKRARVSGPVLTFKEDWGYENTGRSLQAFAEIAPADPAITKIIRGLFGTRRGGQWMSTRDTSMIVVGLCDYLSNHKEASGNSTVEVILNGELYQTVPIGGNSVEPVKIVWPIAKLADEANTVELKVTGGGNPWYALESTQTPYQPEIGYLVSQSGLSIERSYHELAAKRLEDGTSRLMPVETPTATFQSGQPVRCRLRIIAEREYEFVMIEVPTPANFHITENAEPDTWNWWWSSMMILDDRVVLFARTIEKGEHLIEFNVKPETPGQATALPTHIFEMYSPQTEGSSAGLRVEVRP